MDQHEWTTDAQDDAKLEWKTAASFNEAMSQWQVHAQVAVRSRHGLDQYVQPAMRFAASAYRSPEDRASLAWQDACIAAQLRSTHAAAALCQSAQQAGSCSRAHADASQGVDGPGEPDGQQPADCRPLMLGTGNSAPYTELDIGRRELKPWQDAVSKSAPVPEMHAHKVQIRADEAAVSGRFVLVHSSGATSRMLPFDQMASSTGGRTSVVDAWLAQNRAVLAQLP